MSLQYKNIPYSLDLGREIDYTPDLMNITDHITKQYSFMMLPLVKKGLYRTEKSVSKNPLRLSRTYACHGSESIRENNMKRVNKFAVIKPSIDLESEVDHIRERAEYCLMEEIEFAEYLKIGTVIFDLPIYQIEKIDDIEEIKGQDYINERPDTSFIDDEIIFPHNFWRILNSYKLLQDIGACGKS